MTVTTDILDSINAEALAFKQAKAQYDDAFRSFKAGVPPLAPDQFWPMADTLRQVVLRTMVYRTERIGVLAAEEFMRLAVIGSLPWSLSAAVHFCLSYRHYKFLAYAGGDECKFSFDRGDDGYGDLMDAVVLLGREFNQQLYAGRFYDLPDFHKAVSQLCQASVTAEDFDFPYSQWPGAEREALAARFCTLVLGGENYFAMSLEDEAANRVVIHAKPEGRDE
jgi:hypothetical protein